jgi:ribosomal RNA assembly protein
MESGEYFLKAKEKQTRELNKRKEAQEMTANMRREEKEKVFIPPEEPNDIKTKYHEASSSERSIEALKKKFQDESQKRKEQHERLKESIDDYVDTGKRKTLHHYPKL